MGRLNQFIILGLLCVVFASCGSKKAVKAKEGTALEEIQRFEKQEQEHQSQMAEMMKAQYAKMPFFPAQIIQGENFYSVQIIADVGAFYASEFGKYGLYGNGYCWEGIVEQLVAKKQKALLSKISFDAEADTCFIACKDKNSMEELARFINRELSSKAKFNEVIQSIDKSELDC
ncbi:MAG: Imm51 family immunity protein [Bacteroidota bacterium]